MRKYLVIDQKKYGDEYIDVHDTLEDANTDAEYQWDHLTRNEKKGTSYLCRPCRGQR